MTAQAAKTHRFYAVMKKTGWRCYYCGKGPRPLMSIAGKARERVPMTIDHVIPVVAGGTDDLANLVPACGLCNSAKGAGSVEELRHILAIRLSGMPMFTFEQIVWMRGHGCDLAEYDGFQFWFEHQARRQSVSEVGGT